MNLSKIIRAIIGLFFITLSHFSFAQQQTALVKGQVLTADSKLAESINVVISPLNVGTTTSKDGVYKFNNIPYGDYTITFSLIGMETKTINIRVDATVTSIPDVVLSENEEELEEVLIVAERLNQFAQKESEYVAKVPLKNINNPQSYSIVTGALLEEQLNTDLPSAFKSITGGGYVESNDGNVSVYLRGFRSDVHLRNGGIAWVKAPIDPQNIERIELIKGPGSLFYGANVNNIANYGGVVNKVTKQAYNGEKIRVGLYRRKLGTKPCNFRL
ncbi:carboxypeptidase-like regulatory domain-containing protein [Formosa algae]|uniref:carboxypeptidase-like regulatory domain-containing protein n=1 Tax=Formosa algae TaxID=225843 RepID=UPI000CCE1A5B|nr:carboxypeptidase-like regulatory domain-containing protein [Formosa algae]PNW26948.1 hypothetical protein BKP44_15220 [Formosa algae]